MRDVQRQVMHIPHTALAASQPKLQFQREMPKDQQHSAATGVHGCARLALCSLLICVTRLHAFDVEPT